MALPFQAKRLGTAALVVLILLAATIWRVATDRLSLTQHVEGWEAMNVAQSFANGKGFSDSYFAGQGATAHFTPVMPILSGSLVALSAGHEKLGNLALLSFSLLQVLAAYLVLFILFRRQFGLTAAFIGLAIISLPLNAWYETGAFRYWDGALCTLLTAVSLLLGLIVAERPPCLRHILALAALLAIGIFTNQITGGATCLAIAAMLIARNNLLLIRIALTTALMLAVMVVPWSVRNYERFGRLIPFRSNASLELALAFYPGVEHSPDTQAEYNGRMDQIHPTVSEPARAQVRRVGEVAYFERLGASTRAWMRDHTHEVVRVSIRHIKDYVFPNDWRMGGRVLGVRARYISVAVTLLGLLGIGIATWRGNRLALASGVFVVVSFLPFLLINPVPRYTYTTYCLMTFWAGFTIYLLAAEMLRRLPESRLA